MGIDPVAMFPGPLPGGSPVGEHVKITERIALENESTLIFNVTIDAPELFTAPDLRRIPFARSEQTTAREIDACVDFDRAIDRATGLERFDMTPPADLPPPPRARP